MATPIYTKGPEIPCYDDFLNPANQPGLTVHRRTWKNDTTNGPIGVSPIQQDQTYLIARKAVVFRDKNGIDVWEYTTAIPVKGSDLVSPAQSADHAPPELQQVVPIKDGPTLLMIWKAVETP